MASESKKIRKSGGAPAPASTSAPPGAAATVDPLSPERLKGLLLRLGVPLLVIWFIGALIAGFAVSSVVRTLAIGLPAALTLAALGLVVWVVRQARKAQGVAGILSRATETKEGRQAALAELDAKYKGDDPTAVFARAQLLLQEDPRKALEALEAINLSKVMGSVADEARGQRAMIHLMLGEVAPARDLVDGIQLARHQDARSRAMLAAVVAEAWARSGQAKRAVDTLSAINVDDPELAQLRPQIWRAQAYAYAHTEDMKSATRALRKLAGQDARMLGGFMTKKTHPLLQREARKLLEQSGVMQRKMQVQRRP